MINTNVFSKFILDTGPLARRKKTFFEHRLESAELKALIAELGLSGLRKVSFSGELASAEKNDWALEAKLGATAVQPCTITLEPVTTRIESDVTRRYVTEISKHFDTSEEGEFGGTAILDDDTLEPLGKKIDLWSLLVESLALALPDYPRAEGAKLGTLKITKPGKDAMSNEDLKPFAGLADLKSKLEGKS